MALNTTHHETPKHPTPPTPPAPPAPPAETPLDKLEKARLHAERLMRPDALSVVVQHRHVRARSAGPTAGTFHFEDTELLPGFTTDDARKLKGGEGAQFRTDAVRMVELETARVAQLHTIVGTSDIHLALDGTIMDPVDWAGLDAALAKANEQVIAGEDQGDSDVKEIAIVSAALQETARYQAVSGPEQAPPPEGGALAAKPQALSPDPPIGKTAADVKKP